MERRRDRSNRLMNIYIPSRGRFNSKMDTIASLPDKWLPYTYLVVHAKELKLYKKAITKPVKFIACPVKGIHKVRQWIMEHAHNRCDYALFLDDDMQFAYRTEGVKMAKAKPKHVNKMLVLLKHWLNSGWVHVGISQRAGNNHVPEDYTETTRMNNAYAYNVKKFLETGVRFDRLEVMEDFDVTLSLLERGINNRVTFWYAWSQRKSGDKGGCSLYRTSKLQTKAANQLAKLHPGVVNVIQKISKQRWEGMEGKTRTDVIIQWKKAYKPKINKNAGISRFL